MQQHTSLRQCNRPQAHAQNRNASRAARRLLAGAPNPMPGACRACLSTAIEPAVTQPGAQHAGVRWLGATSQQVERTAAS